jgi:hypothetical protein
MAVMVGLVFRAVAVELCLERLALLNMCFQGSVKPRCCFTFREEICPAPGTDPLVRHSTLLAGWSR